MTEAGEKWAVLWSKEFFGFTHNDAQADYMKQSIRIYESVLSDFVSEVKKRAKASANKLQEETCSDPATCGECLKIIGTNFTELSRELLGPPKGE